MGVARWLFRVKESLLTSASICRERKTAVVWISEAWIRGSRKKLVCQRCFSSLCWGAGDFREWLKVTSKFAGTFPSDGLCWRCRNKNMPITKSWGIIFKIQRVSSLLGFVRLRIITPKELLSIFIVWLQCLYTSCMMMHPKSMTIYTPTFILGVSWEWTVSTFGWEAAFWCWIPKHPSLLKCTFKINANTGWDKLSERG